MQTSIFNQISEIPPPQAVFWQLLACLARHPSAFTSMCGTDTAGRGALEPPPEGGARTKLYSTDNFSSANRILRPRQKKTPDQIPDIKEGFYLLAIFFFLLVPSINKVIFEFFISLSPSPVDVIRSRVTKQALLPRPHYGTCLHCYRGEDFSPFFRRRLASNCVTKVFRATVILRSSSTGWGDESVLEGVSESDEGGLAKTKEKS